jgi:hypothetical protein
MNQKSASCEADFTLWLRQPMFTEKRFGHKNLPYSFAIGCFAHK